MKFTEPRDSMNGSKRFILNGHHIFVSILLISFLTIILRSVVAKSVI